MDTEQQAATEEQSPERAARPRRNRPTRDRAGGQRPANPAYRRLSNPFEPIRLLSEDQVETLHRAALDIVQATGMRVLHAEARDIFRQAGAAIDPDSQMVRIDAALVQQAFDTAPRRVPGHRRLAGTIRPDRRAQSRDLHRRRPAQRLRHRDRQASRPARRLPGLHAPRPELRRHPPHQSMRRAARRAAGRAASGGYARAAHSDGQGAVRLQPRRAAGGRLLRHVPHRTRAERSGVRGDALLLHGDQHDLAPATRRPHGAGDPRFRQGRAAARHYAVHAVGRHGAGHHWARSCSSMRRRWSVSRSLSSSGRGRRSSTAHSRRMWT